MSYGLEPSVEFGLFVAIADFIFPVCRKTFFGDLVHSFGSDLDFDPVSVGPHHGEVEGLVSVGFGGYDPVARPAGV